jgi:GTPase SAR1 family protein
LRPLFYVNANIILICFSVDDSEAITEINERWIPEVRHYAGRCSVILVGCKTDLRTDPDTIAKLKQQGTEPITKKAGKKLASKTKVDAYMECSAKTGEGVRDLFIQAALLSSKQHAPRER